MSPWEKVLEVVSLILVECKTLEGEVWLLREMGFNPSVIFLALLMDLTSPLLAVTSGVSQWAWQDCWLCRVARSRGPGFCRAVF